MAGISDVRGSDRFTTSIRADWPDRQVLDYAHSWGRGDASNQTSWVTHISGIKPVSISSPMQIAARRRPATSSETFETSDLVKRLGMMLGTNAEEKCLHESKKVSTPDWAAQLSL